MAITWRNATPEDYQAVLDIDPDHKIYGGNDYIPVEYHRFLQDPDMKIAVYEKNGKVVAMNLGHIVDDGQTIIIMAARTHRDTRREGLWRIMRHNPPGLQSLNNVKYFCHVADWQLTKHVTDSIWELPNFLCKRVARIFEFDPSIIEHKDSFQTQNGITKILSESETLDVLRNPETQWRVFPNKRIMCDSNYAVYRLLDKNFQNIVTNMKCITASLDSHAQCTSMAFAHGNDVHNGYLYVINYYCSDPADVMDVVRHVIIHLPIAAKLQSKKPLRIRLIFPVVMSEPDITNAFKAVRRYVALVGNTSELEIFERERKVEIQAKL